MTPYDQAPVRRPVEGDEVRFRSSIVVSSHARVATSSDATDNGAFSRAPQLPTWHTTGTACSRTADLNVWLHRSFQGSSGALPSIRRVRSFEQVRGSGVKYDRATTTRGAAIVGIVVALVIITALPPVSSLLDGDIPLPGTQSESDCTVRLPASSVNLELKGPRAGYWCRQLVANRHVGWRYGSHTGTRACSFEISEANGTFRYDPGSFVGADRLCFGWGPGIPPNA